MFTEICVASAAEIVLVASVVLTLCLEMFIFLLPALVEPSILPTYITYILVHIRRRTVTRIPSLCDTIIDKNFLTFFRVKLMSQSVTHRIKHL